MVLIIRQIPVLVNIRIFFILILGTNTEEQTLSKNEEEDEDRKNPFGDLKQKGEFGEQDHSRQQWCPIENPDYDDQLQDIVIDDIKNRKILKQIDGDFIVEQAFNKVRIFCTF